MTVAHDREWQHAGLLMHGSDDDYVKLAFTRNASGGRIMEFQTEAGGTRSWHANVGVPAGFPATAHLRLVSDGAKLTAAYSADGQAWTALAGSATVIPNATVGLMAAGDVGTSRVTAVFDNFTLTPDGTDDGVRTPGDEFDGSTVDGCRWNAVVRYDSTTVAVSNGALRIETQPGDINGTNNSARNVILQQIPADVAAGDWTIETKLTPTMLHQWQLAGFLVYGNDDNYVKFDVVANNAAGTRPDLRAELVSERNAQFGNGGNRSIDLADTSESGWYYLRLSRSGNNYSAQISDGGINWTSLGEPVTNDAAMTSFGLMALGPEQRQPVTVAFDYFRILEKSELPLTATAQVRCVAGRAYVAVQATNDHDATVSIALESAYGNRAAADVAPGANAFQQFNTRTTAIPAGSATVRATGTLNGTAVTTVVTRQYAAVNCADPRTAQ